MLAETTVARRGAEAHRRRPVTGHGLVTQERAARAQGRGTVARLLAAGLAEFEERGFQAVTVDDIVRRANASHGTFYMYFANKDDFFGALSQEALRAMDRITDEFPVVTPDGAGRAALRKWVSDFCDTYAAHAVVLGALSQVQVVGRDAWCPGSPRLLLKALRAPGRVHPWVTAAACLPRGRARHEELRRTVNGMLARRHRAEPGTGQTWITAVDYDSGRRVVFGRDGAPPATLAEAVVASCSVPCWYQPAVIGSRRYIDGGVRSGSNADLLVRAGIARAYVLAPAASLVSAPPRGLVEHLEHVVRRLMTRALIKEVALLRGRGLDVTVLTPGPADLAAMGGNLMDHRRREAVFETSLRTSEAAMSGQPNARRAARPRDRSRPQPGPARQAALSPGEGGAP